MPEKVYSCTKHA